MGKIRVAVTAIAVGAAYAAGMATQDWREDRLLRKNACSVRVWHPGTGFVYQSQDDRDCLSLGEPQRFEGVFSDFAMGGDFKIDGDTPNKEYELSADGLTRAQLQWLARRQAKPEFFTGERYHIEFVGRIGHRGSGEVDGRSDIIVVDRLIAATALPRS